MSNEKQNAFKPMLAALSSGEEQQIISAIGQLRKKGNATTVQAVIDVLLQQPSPLIESEINSYLNDLQDDAAIQPLIDSIGDYRFKPYKAMLIAAFWQSAIDASDHLLFFIEQLEEASYEELLEIITVIENLNGPFVETEIMESISRLNEFVYEAEDEEKRNLLESLNEVLNQL
jgi:formate dehydrogenase maturation protein FdhE